MAKKTKTYTGEVISDRMQKSVVVVVKSLYQHPVYKKTVKRITKLMAHDPEGLSKAGDTVSIMETRPLSKNKKWLVREVIKKA